jgi:hypothetical protein
LHDSRRRRQQRVGYTSKAKAVREEDREESEQDDEDEEESWLKTTDSEGIHGVERKFAEAGVLTKIKLVNSVRHSESWQRDNCGETLHGADGGGRFL